MTTLASRRSPPAEECVGSPEHRSTPALVRVRVLGGDPVTRAGVTALLGVARDLTVYPDADADEPTDIAVVVVNSLTPLVLAVLRRLGANPARRMVLVLGDLSQEGLAAVLQAGAVGMIRRRDATAESLCQLVRSAVAGIPRQLERELSGHPGPIPHPSTMVYLSDRELAVLSMLGEGADTREISLRMRYSERTVKTIIQDIIRRLGLRNRSHAVCYGVRHGLI